MTVQQRRDLVNGALAITQDAEGWATVIPLARGILDRMAKNLDAPQEQRQQMGRWLSDAIQGEPGFRADPLYAPLANVAREFGAD